MYALKVGCYKEIHRVLKPGQCFAAYEWCMTNSFDPNNKEHQSIKVLNFNQFSSCYYIIGFWLNYTLHILMVFQKLDFAPWVSKFSEDVVTMVDESIINSRLIL